MSFLDFSYAFFSKFFSNFSDVPDILLIARKTAENRCLYNLITTKFYGENFPITLNTFDSETKLFCNGSINLFPNKLLNLQGRAMKLSLVNYVPFTYWMEVVC